ncbi:hypothetical protein [Kaistella yonginensis]|uniref:hypothetical protein n=1 Tax=Kaistella yonginensis TaxID=658267 RepID=UPI0025B2ECD2|nr:hypothetical protein [Kaistella yonginensis]MDN3607097.1 hypothetical protein [Kaistella yonginensis]
MKTILILLISIFTFSCVSAQENEKLEKIKIGKYKYEIYLKENWFYEENKSFINYILRFKNRERFLGNHLTYRKTGSSKNYEKKVSEELPPDMRSTYKDGVILSEGNITIDEKNKEIVILEKTFYKDEDFEDNPDSTKRIYKQKKDGYFELIKIIENKNGQESIVLKK